jgi:MYXO-CTERM domain-containing protein
VVTCLAPSYEIASYLGRRRDDTASVTFALVKRLWSWTRRYGADLLIAGAAVEAAVQVATAGDDPQAPRAVTWVAALAAAGLVAPLFARRRWPFAAPAALWLLAAAISFADGRLVVFSAGDYVAGLVAAFLLGSLRNENAGRAGLAVTIGAAAIVMYNNPEHGTGDLIVLPVLFGLAWLAGLAQRNQAVQAETAEQRAEQAEGEREAAARVAVAEERARIARELHDIVAHAVSVMVLHVGAVRNRLPGELAEDARALQEVEQTGRGALGEMRRLLGALRRDDEPGELAPQPGLARLEPLLQHVRSAGLDVGLEVDGDPFPLPDAIDISAYRIVQEGLTNTLKHAHASEARVVIGYASDEVRIDVRDDGDGAPSGDGLGHGLIGIRERVKIYGGEMTAAPASDGGFVLSTRLPLTGAHA